MIWSPAFFSSPGYGPRSAQSQALEPCSLVHLCQSSDVHRGGRGASGEREGGRDGLELFKAGLYFRDFLQYIVRETHTHTHRRSVSRPLCALYLKQCFHKNQTAVIFAPTDNTLLFQCACRTSTTNSGPVVWLHSTSGCSSTKAFSVIVRQSSPHTAVRIVSGSTVKMSSASSGPGYVWLILTPACLAAGPFNMYRQQVFWTVCRRTENPSTLHHTILQENSVLFLLLLPATIQSSEWTHSTAWKSPSDKFLCLSLHLFKHAWRSSSLPIHHIQCMLETVWLTVQLAV